MTTVDQRIPTMTVEEAHRQIAPYIRRTPVTAYGTVGRSNELWIKEETKQLTGSFKLRGALSLAHYLKQEGHEMVVTASAGNHGAGVAYSARALDMKSFVYVPETTPESKLTNIRRLGGDAVELIVRGADFDETSRIAQEVSWRTGVTYLPPFDHPIVAAGQGTMVREVLEDLEGVDKVFVPVGGGGALAGALQAIDEAGTDTTVVAVQYSFNTALEQSVNSDQLVTLSHTDNLCEGTSVKQASAGNVEMVRRYLDRVEFMAVGAEDVGRELMYQDLSRQVLVPVLGKLAFDHFPETTGLLAAAGAREYASRHPEAHDQRWVALATGSNTDPAREAAVITAWKKSSKRF